LRRRFEAQVLPAFADHVLPIDTAVARRCGKLHVPDRQGERGPLIAATALIRGMAVVTRNVADLGPTGVTLVNPWQI
jgi:predicted nucleic acid-binding protein